MSDVFISYSHQQKGWVENFLVKELSKPEYHIDIWWDKNIETDVMDWQDEIDRQLNLAKLVLIIMTPDAAKSENVTYEWAYALGQGKGILIVEREATSKKHARLNSVQIFDLTDKTFDMSKLIAEIQKRLSGINTGNSSPINLMNKTGLIDILAELRRDDILSKSHLYNFISSNLIALEDIDDIERKAK